MRQARVFRGKVCNSCKALEVAPSGVTPIEVVVEALLAEHFTLYPPDESRPRTGYGLHTFYPFINMGVPIV
jgi:hypothetical protein